jgi:hypothetical protein
VDALAAWARADSAATLSPEHPVNRALAEASAGTVARLLHSDPRRRIATIACAPLRACLELPFGWHAIEHEDHLALFEPARQVQIQLGLVERCGRSAAAALDALELELCGRRPAPDVLRLHHAGWHALALRECLDGRVPLEQYHLMTDGPDAGTLTHTRVLATPLRSAEAVALAEALLAGLVFDPAHAAPGPAAAATNETRPGLR